MPSGLYHIKLWEAIDGSRNIVYTYTDGEVDGIEYSDGNEYGVERDQYGRIMTETIKAGGTTYSVTYMYQDGDAYNGDRLISFNGENYAYNVLGNPTTYRGKALTWLRGELFSKYGGTAFTYDGAGKRTGKESRLCIRRVGQPCGAQCERNGLRKRNRGIKSLPLPRPLL